MRFLIPTKLSNNLTTGYIDAYMYMYIQNRLGIQRVNYHGCSHECTVGPGLLQVSNNCASCFNCHNTIIMLTCACIYIVHANHKPYADTITENAIAFGYATQTVPTIYNNHTVEYVL